SEGSQHASRRPLATTSPSSPWPLSSCGYDKCPQHLAPTRQSAYPHLAHHPCPVTTSEQASAAHDLWCLRSGAGHVGDEAQQDSSGILLVSAIAGGKEA